MGSLLIVELQPGGQRRLPMVRGGIRYCVSPFALQRLNEALGLAVGLRPAWPRMFGRNREPAADFEKCPGAISSAVIGKDTLNADAAGWNSRPARNQKRVAVQRFVLIFPHLDAGNMRTS